MGGSDGLRDGGVTEEIIHELKCWPEFFAALLDRSKTFEVRRDDRDFRVGHTLHLMEWSAAHGYSGRELRFRVTYIVGIAGATQGYAVMALAAMTEKP